MNLVNWVDLPHKQPTMDCPMCTDYSVPSFNLLLNHIGLVHANNYGFKITCGVDFCEATYTSFRRFKEHLKKKHNLPKTNVGAIDNHNESGPINCDNSYHRDADDDDDDDDDWVVEDDEMEDRGANGGKADDETDSSSIKLFGS